MKIVILIMLQFLVIDLAFAQKEKSDDANSIGRMGELASSMLKFLPGDLSKAVQTYLEVMQPSAYGSDNNVGQANKGLKSTFISKISENKCLGFLAEKLYADPAIKGGAKTNISILESGSSLKSKNLEPGWVWKKAMELTEGNPNMAMSLLGMCGHDDVAQGADNVCPSEYSNFYLPKGLGKEVDISDEIRQYVIQTQSIDADPKNIKGKNYHFYGSAYLGCRMIEKGVPPEKIADYAQKFAFAYRRVRICRTAVETVKALEPINQIYQQQLLNFNRSGGNGKAPTLRSVFIDEILKSRQRGLDHFGAKYTYLSTQEEKNKFVDKIIATYNASKLYDTITDCPKSSANEKSEAFQTLAIGKSSMNNNTLVFGYDAEKFEESCRLIAGAGCEDARKTLLTWDADFKWTMAQHRAGSDFGAKNCKKLDDPAAQKQPQICSTMPSDYRFGGRRRIAVDEEMMNKQVFKEQNVAPVAKPKPATSQ